MKKEMKTILNLLSISALAMLPFSLNAQDDGTTPPVDEGPSFDVPVTDPPPIDIPNGDGEGEPPIDEDIPDDLPPPEVQEFLLAMEAFRSGIMGIIENTEIAPEDRGQAIRDYIMANRPSLDEMEAAAEEVNVAASVEELPVDLPDRPNASTNMQDLNALYDDKLAGLELDNVNLQEKLAAAQLAREEALGELEAARAERAQSMEDAREFARQMIEQARGESENADRRPDDKP